MAIISSSTTTERPTTTAAVASDHLLRLILSLSPSTASKVIAKHHGGGHQHQHQHQHRVAGGAFRCKTCGRAFPTFQALGGHRTSHKRPLVRAHGLDLLLGARPGKKGATAASDVHRCTTCGAVFPTGQALGGHMRRHRAAATAFDFDVAVPVHGESEMVTRVVGDESDDDDARSIRLFKFI